MVESISQVQEPAVARGQEGAEGRPPRSGGPRRAPVSRGAVRRRRGPGAISVPIVGAFCAVAIYLGWRTRDELIFSPEQPLGYALGIIGTALMVLLLAYSLRKHLRWLSAAGPIRTWFAVHMALGLLGPTAILFHCNFQLGSQNANVALVCALAVSGSGVIGRFLYPKIHLSLSGGRASLRDLRRELDAQRGAIGAACGAVPALAAPLSRFESLALGERTGVVGRAARFAALPFAARRARVACRRVLRAATRARRIDAAEAREIFREARERLDAVRRVAEFGVYERIFSLWHVLHLPLCFLMFFAAVVHVVAVHMY